MPEPHRIAADEAIDFAGRILQAAGAAPGEAQRVAVSLVESNLRGHDSHGIVRVPDYVKQIRRGDLVPGVELQIVSETASLLVADAGMGFGMVQCERLIERLQPKATEQGIACGTLRNCGHVGRLGEWAELIASRGLAGLIAVNDNGVLQCVAPPGGTTPTISTNPIAIGVPSSDGPLVLDISTSAVANGKVKVAWVDGRQCPPGWLLDAVGDPTTDPAVRFTDPRGTLLPMGGPQGYKGFGLGLYLDFLVGGLSGGFCPPAPPGAPGTNNVLLMLWNPDSFFGRDHLLGEVDKLIADVRGVRRKPGVERIQLPGDRSRACREERMASGLAVDAGVWRRLTDLARELDVEIPRGAG